MATASRPGASGERQRLRDDHHPDCRATTHGRPRRTPSRAPPLRTGMPLHARATTARLASVARCQRGPRHTCKQTNDGDDRPDILPRTEPEDTRVSPVQPQSDNCSGIVGERTPLSGPRLGSKLKVGRPRGFPCRNNSRVAPTDAGYLQTDSQSWGEKVPGKLLEQAFAPLVQRQRFFFKDQPGHSSTETRYRRDRADFSAGRGCSGASWRKGLSHDLVNRPSIMTW